MNPTAPTLHATIELHKNNTPIRPIINWKHAPAYRHLHCHSRTTRTQKNIQEENYRKCNTTEKTEASIKLTVKKQKRERRKGTRN
jgi:hypothetical protein